MSKELSVGDPAPDFTAIDQDGKEHSLSGYRGSKVVLYFYPKDSTPGCTTQACDFRDAAEAISAKNGVVLGVSADSRESHEKFAGKYDLNFPLLVDEDHSISEAYGVWVGKKMFGKSFEGIKRSTFIIDEEGNIASIERGVKVAGHVDGVLEELDA